MGHLNCLSCVVPLGSLLKLPNPGNLYANNFNNIILPSYLQRNFAAFVSPPFLIPFNLSCICPCIPSSWNSLPGISKMRARYSWLNAFSLLSFCHPHSHPLFYNWPSLPIIASPAALWFSSIIRQHSICCQVSWKKKTYLVQGRSFGKEVIVVRFHRLRRTGKEIILIHHPFRLWIQRRRETYIIPRKCGVIRHPNHCLQMLHLIGGKQHTLLQTRQESPQNMQAPHKTPPSQHNAGRDSHHTTRHSIRGVEVPTLHPVEHFPLESSYWCWLPSMATITPGIVTIVPGATDAMGTRSFWEIWSWILVFVSILALCRKDSWVRATVFLFPHPALYFAVVTGCIGATATLRNLWGILAPMDVRLPLMSTY